MFSVVLYVYYKVAILKTKDIVTQKYYNAKSRVCLGSFLVFFGINQYIAYQTKFILFISIVFVLLGLYQAIYGINEARHYRKEWKKLNPDS